MQASEFIETIGTGKVGRHLVNCHTTWDGGPRRYRVVRPLPDAALIPICFIGVARLSYKFNNNDWLGRNVAAVVGIGFDRFKFVVLTGIKAKAQRKL